MDFDLEKELNKELNKFYKEINKNLEDANKECAEVLKEELEKEAKKVIKSPKKYYKNFIIKQYKGFAFYVGNTMRTKEKIPLSRILESGATRVNRGVMKPRPHFRTAFDKTKEKMIKLIEERIVK
jgi:CRISPR/Cas system CMR subunit Cmr6 (Cas7 group RAMP superfamily)